MLLCWVPRVLGEGMWSEGGMPSDRVGRGDQTEEILGVWRQEVWEMGLSSPQPVQEGSG